jgi:hypothetical protein
MPQTFLTQHQVGIAPTRGKKNTSSSQARDVATGSRTMMTRMDTPIIKAF